MDPTLEKQIPSTPSTISLEVHNSIQDQDLREISKDSLLTQTDHPQDSTIEIILTIRVIDSQEREILLEISTTIGKTTPHSKEETSRPTEITITLKRETSTHPEIKIIEDLPILNPKQTGKNFTNNYRKVSFKTSQDQGNINENRNKRTNHFIKNIHEEEDDEIPTQNQE